LAILLTPFGLLAPKDIYIIKFIGINEMSLPCVVCTMSAIVDLYHVVDILIFYEMITMSDLYQLSNKNIDIKFSAHNAVFLK
jgi:hypothetical protein